MVKTHKGEQTMKRILTGLFGVLLLLALSSVTFAQGDQAADAKKTTTKKASTNTNFAGTVSAISATSVTVKGTKGDHTATLNDKTKYKKESDGSAAASSDIKEGEYIHVWASKDKSGNWIATTIRIGKKEAKKASTPAKK